MTRSFPSALRRPVLSALVAPAVALALASGAACAKETPAATTTGATTASTVSVPSGATIPSSRSTSSSVVGSGAGSSTSTGGAPPGGGRLYGDPSEQIVADIGDEFAIKLPKPEKEWLWDEDCINAKPLGQKTQSDGSVLFRFQMNVSGACHLDFFDSSPVSKEAEGDVRFDLVDPDLAD